MGIQYLKNKANNTSANSYIVDTYYFILMIADIPFEVYNEQNMLLNYILPSLQLYFAVPLYRNIHVMKKHAVPILAGVTVGTLATMGSLVIIGS